MNRFLFIAFTIMTMAATAQTKFATKVDPKGRYDLVVGTLAPLSIFESKAYDYTPGFFAGFSKAKAGDLGIGGKRAWDEFGDSAKLIVIDKDATVWFPNGAQWIECYLDGCIKDGKPYYNRLQVVGRKIVEVTEVEVEKQVAVAGKNGINCWDLNQNGINDPEEDVNHDGHFNVLDCQGPQGPAGPQGPQGAPGASANCNCNTTPTYAYGTTPYGYGYSQPSYGYYGGYTPARSVEVNVGLELNIQKGGGSNTNINNNTQNVYVNTGGTKSTPTPTNPRGTFTTNSGGCPPGTFPFNGGCMPTGNGSANQPPFTTTTTDQGSANQPGQTTQQSGQGHTGDPGNPFQGTTYGDTRYGMVNTAPANTQQYYYGQQTSPNYGTVNQSQNSGRYQIAPTQAQYTNTGYSNTPTTTRYSTPNLEQKGFFYNGSAPAYKASGQNFSNGSGSGRGFFFKK